MQPDVDIFFALCINNYLAQFCKMNLKSSLLLRILGLIIRKIESNIQCLWMQIASLKAALAKKEGERQQLHRSRPAVQKDLKYHRHFLCNLVGRVQEKWQLVIDNQWRMLET